jgi:hypothetical protein
VRRNQLLYCLSQPRCYQCKRCRSIGQSFARRIKGPRAWPRHLQHWHSNRSSSDRARRPPILAFVIRLTSGLPTRNVSAGEGPAGNPQVFAREKGVRVEDDCPNCIPVNVVPVSRGSSQRLGSSMSHRVRAPAPDPRIAGAWARPRSVKSWELGSLPSSPCVESASGPKTQSSRRRSVLVDESAQDRSS